MYFKLIILGLLINVSLSAWGQCGAEGSWMSKHIPDSENIKKDLKFGLKSAIAAGIGLSILKFLVWFL